MKILKVKKYYLLIKKMIVKVNLLIILQKKLQKNKVKIKNQADGTK